VPRRDRQASPADPGRMVSDESLAALLERITPANRHQEVDWGQPVGKEMW
jgi:antitoxin component of MazEF toxin-antitoxin module